ncbi:TolC family protein [Reinekea blandensis]|uniref:Type I secretion outer membrane protein n=1 Tax=Reinekea blandensis MED297 TaxID=314283 RepID=A4BF84_9GAMM|nr:TolC family protein [Reinekea blandensis]EAR09197.1 type I secretion outer membrane protein [Reinekea sp. MED297] [Reinekea blandensis MED297]
MKHSLLPLLLLSVGLSSPLYANSEIENTWQQLLTEHAGLAAEQQTLTAREADLSVARGRRLPSISLTSQWNLMDDELGVWFDTSTLMPGGGPVYFPVQEESFWDTELTATLPLFTGGKISAGIDAKQAEIRLQQAKVAQSQQSLFVRYVERYLQVTLAKQNRDIRKLALDSLESQLARAIRMQQEGTIAYTERLQAEVERDKARREWRAAVSNYELAAQAYQSMFANAPALPVEPMRFQPYTTLDAADLTQQTLVTHPGLQQVNAKHDLADAAVKASRADLLPTVGLFAKTELATDDLTQLDPEWTAGVRLSWHLFGNGNRWQAIQSQHANQRAAELTGQQLERDLTVGVQKQLTAISQAIEAIEALDSSVKLAEENLRLQSAAFNQGVATSLDKIDAQLLLTGLQLEQQRALYDYYVAVAQLTAMTGNVDSFFQLF